MEQPRSLTIAARMWLVTGLAAACLVALSAASVRVLEGQLMAERKARILATVKLAHALVAYHGSLAAAGKVTSEEARRAALEAARAVHDDAREYVWIQDLQAVMLMHPVRPDLVGKDLSQAAGPDGARVYSSFVDVVRASPGRGGFIEYRWRKDGSGAPVRKLSYVMLYEPWGWVLGSGVYLDDLEATVAEEAHRLFTAAAAVAVLLGLGGFLAARGVKRAVGAICLEATRLQQAVAEGKLDRRGDASKVSQEFRPIVHGMNRTMDAFVAPIQVTAAHVHRIGKGQIPPRIAEAYRGHFNILKHNLNYAIDAVERLKEREAQLAAAHRKATRARDNLRKILESIPDVVVLTRLDGSIAFVNGAGQKMFGIPPGAAVKTRSVADRVVPEDRQLLVRRQEAAAAGRDPGHATVRVLGAEGVRECEINGLRIEFEGEPAIVTMVRDVTERREMDRKLALADRLASLGTLTAGVAHEINNPLSYILSNLKLLAGELAEREPCLAPGRVAELRDLAAEALEGGERVRRIVQDLHAFSRPSEKLGPVDVQRVLELAINMASSQIRYRASVARDYGEVPTVNADESRLGQVALNLIINAAHAIPEGRPRENEIRVSTRMQGSDRLVIAIGDTGCGIPSEIRSRIFEPFFTTKPVGTGTGLGLSICHGIVSSLGGEISVESELGKGTVFRVVLPVGEAVRLPSAAA